MRAPSHANDDSNPTFRKRLAELMREKHLTASTLTKLIYDTTAEVTDEQKEKGVWISEGTQRNWRRGTGTEPRGGTLTVLAEHLGVSEKYLLGRSNVRRIDEVKIDKAIGRTRRKKPPK